MNLKCFQNMFTDYSIESSRDLIYNEQIKPDCKVFKESESFYSNASSAFKPYSSNDNTVFTGTAGIALYLLLKSETDPSALNEAVKFLGLEKLKNRRVTFLCGDAGPLAIGAVVYHKLGNTEKVKRIVDTLLNLGADVLDPKSDLPNELLYGRVGYLYALLFINSHVSPPPIEGKVIKKIISIIFSVGKLGAKMHAPKEVPLMFEWHNKHYLGAAHGLSGIMYILLQASQFLSKTELNDLVKPTIDYLLKTRYPSGNFMSSLGSDTDRLVQWCHGAPGFTHLYCKAYEVFKDPKYLEVALECGEVVWQRGLLKKGYSMCHGVSGNAYTFLALFQETKDPKHLYRAIKFAEWCLDSDSEHEEHKPDHPLSLFEGLTGRLYLLEDLKNPMNAKFPAYTL